MSQQDRQDRVQEQTRQLLRGRLKHVGAAALAAALVPLATVTVTRAAVVECASAGPSSGNICGTVWNDANMNGIQDNGETAIQGAVVTLSDGQVTSTDSNGQYGFWVLDAATYTVAVQVPPGMSISPTNATADTTTDSNGTTDNVGDSAATVTYNGLSVTNVDFGFFNTPVSQPGTGTPGYWKNHPSAWPAPTITVGGVTYTVNQAIALLSDTPNKDKTYTMFSSLVSAKLNVMVGNDSSCIATTIADADNWMHTYGPAGNKVAASSYAWKVGEPLHRQMDNYNNGMLCAPHRD